MKKEIFLFFTLNISKLAALSLSSIRELERGLEASLSDKTMMSGEGVSLPRSGSLDKKKGKIKVFPTVKFIEKLRKLLCYSEQKNPRELI